ncbi:MAG: hypothetical protein ABR99_05155 [Rhodobacter sp. BACL10 MAG-121220-bin24]|nr:MAG: hypothetical protein ABR99_05155 [Rhodobacter sp. BACL10 MAG-121220-bin24]
MLTAAFRAFGGEEIVRHFLVTLPGGFWFQFFVVMAVIFVLGFFLDFIEIAVVVVPIVAPILLANPEANVTAVWLGVMIGLNIQTSFLTPPFGFALFYLRGVAPAIVRTVDIYKGVVPFIGLQLMALVIVALMPSLVNYLPNRSSLLAESSPPPRNPRLQYCLDEYNHGFAKDFGADLRANLSPLASLEAKDLPKSVAKFMQEGVKGLDATYAALDAIFVAEDAINNSAGAYRPVLTQVRKVEKEIRLLESENQRDAQAISRMSTAESNAARLAQLQGAIAGNEAKIAEFRLQIPSDWKSTFGAFHDILNTEEKARSDYRRLADNTYGAFEDMAKFLASSSEFTALDDRITALKSQIETDNLKTLSKEVKTLAADFGKLKSGGEVKSSLEKLQKAMAKSKPDLAAVSREYSVAMTAFDVGVAFFEGPAATITQVLAQVEPQLKVSVGARQQDKLTREQALSIAACSSHHRDVSLNF